MTRNGTVAAAVLAGVIATAGCGGASQAPSAATTPAATAAQASATIGAALDAAHFQAAMKEPRTVILDVRTPEEFASGHLPHAVNLDIAGDFQAGLAALDPTRPYAVYCRSGNRSAQALAAMSAAGFTHAYHLDGGISAWEAAGGPITR